MKYKAGDIIRWKWSNRQKEKPYNIGTILSASGKSYYTSYYDAYWNMYRKESLQSNWVDTKQVRKANKHEIVTAKLLGIKWE